jgi:uncharacterized Zn finger protein (UPF0148 family)
MSEPNLDELCHHCGQTLSNFLHQMEEHNAEVVCPSCGKRHNKTSPAERTAKTPHTSE